ncbi:MULTISPECIES: nuclear transport factor 2 family protein [Alteromonadaceae]|uniref:nuclear transport factor 2 family protein n=1 Tax=Alteromonadaceae TaxID=72275 RepID=UPI001C098261|nr:MULTISPECIES: nuclear transport factor 2 family protein [Aliiglaciecola]MBU2879790.1 nuclear transport factor 2 family protein [Aliiglaciecola lipolytica]MDO6709931.1 nuclear transport factor 2 family protein [Aliiglaciecola sp. 2_MG-2023]MDO6751079.1 nuclear transport factor 2 family protein [Aliiglaciecola sp. 1_MG-2023]
MSVLKKFENFYRNLSLQSIAHLGDVYAPEATLIDPLSQHQGLKCIKDYFENLLTNTSKCDCLIQHITEVEGDIFVTWKMRIVHPQLNSGKEFEVDGISHLKSANDKIVFHRDYYDLGEMIYEQVPLLKHIIRALKRRLVS